MERADFIRSQRRYTALPTPFQDGPENVETALDIDTYRQLVAIQFDVGNSVLGSGTTGESPTTSPVEEALMRAIMMEEKRNHRNSDIAVIGGVGSNHTRHAIEFMRAAARDKIDGALSVNPYYNKPPQEGLFMHHSLIAAAAPDMPLIIYNIPGRTGVNIEPETLIRLAEACPNVVGVKECNVAQMTPEVIGQYPDDFKVWTGEDGGIVKVMEGGEYKGRRVGVHGAVSVLANADPEGTRQIVDLAARQEYERAQAMLDQRERFIGLLFDLKRGGSPAAIKAFMKRKGYGNGRVRLPLVPAEPELEDELAEEGGNLGFMRLV